MKNNSHLIKPDRGYRYHLVKGYWDDYDEGDNKPHYLRAIAPTPFSIEREGDNLLLDHLRRNKELLNRDPLVLNKVMITQRIDSFLYSWLEFLQCFMWSIIENDISKVLSTMERFYSGSSPEALRDFIHFRGSLKGTQFCLCPDASLYRLKTGKMGSQAVFKTPPDFKFEEIDPLKIKILDRLTYPVLEKGAQCYPEDPFNLLLPLFAGREKIPTDIMPHFGFQNPFAQILQGRVDANTFFNVQRCLKDKMFGNVSGNKKTELKTIPKLKISTKAHDDTSIEKEIKEHLKKYCEMPLKGQESDRAIAWLDKCLRTVNFSNYKKDDQGFRANLLGIHRTTYNKHRKILM
jgi:hypothetical protein